MASADITVEVVSDRDPAQLRHCWLRLPPGSTVADALLASGLVDLSAVGAVGVEPPVQPPLQPTLQIGCWGKRCALDAVLRDRDRVELYRPLALQPMEARRQRLQRDGLKKQSRKGSR